MPGLKQLRQFSEDMLALGDEEKLRARRGEKVVPVPLPQGISEADDSDDFIIGLPEQKSSAGNDSDAAILDDSPIDLDSLLDNDVGADDDALADFLNDDTLSSPDENGPESLGDGTGPLESGDDGASPVSDETPLEDMDLDSLLRSDSAPADEAAPAAADDIPLEDMDLDSLLRSDSAPDEAASAAADDIPLENMDLDSLLQSEPAPADTEGGVDSAEPTEPLADGTGLSSESEPDLAAALSNLGDLTDLGGMDSLDAPESSPEEPPLTDISLGEEGPDGSLQTPSEGVEEEVVSPDSSSDDSMGGLDSLGDMESFDIDSPSGEAGDLGDLGSFDMDALLSDDEGGAEMEIPDAAMDVPSEGNDEFSADSFDTSGMDGVDFGVPELSAADEFPATDDSLGGDDDFVLDSNFEIPGFSDTDTADLGKKKSILDTVDFSKGSEGVPRNSLTDVEYERFKKNLANYPLNLRIALEDFIARDEFTDDAVFEIIEKVLKKTSARQLATQLEKILDVSINIPRDFERRSFAEYEAYKQSFQYQLKNRIIPAAVFAVVLAFVCFGLFKAGVHFIYKPVMANIHYKQGYTLLEANEFPQSEQEFLEAVSYKPVKKWFFKYALGYRERKQYERAGQMYKRILAYFNHDKQAGLDYAEMELYDRANYERAEEIVRREVLDYHINDAGGILLLGDIFLEWAEEDPSKYELAKEQYLDLIQRYGNDNVYLSRMLRYNIRTDKLREVLAYKNMLYVSKQDRQNLKRLGASDWTELSAYLLEKLYGALSKNDEYLRSSIEDVLALLNLAIKADPSNPVARYNLAIYFIQNGNIEQAKVELERSLSLFESVQVRNKKNVYREINATRVLGELYAGNREYLKAQTVYTRGINLYNEEHESAGLEGDSNTGKLFADMGDLDYFISGEMDDALYNYEKSIEIKNDTPSLNFRVGAIYYNKKNYDRALSSFIKVCESEPHDPNILLSLGNVLSLRGDNFAAESCYSDLLRILDNSRERQRLLLPQDDDDDFEIVDLYLKASNNLGVTLYRLANQTGNSNMNAQAMVRLSDSMRAWDALTRNPDTMIRLDGSNLAAQNSRYITHPHPDFEPAIYTDIPRVLAGEKGLE